MVCDGYLDRINILLNPVYLVNLTAWAMNDPFVDAAESATFPLPDFFSDFPQAPIQVRCKKSNLSHSSAGQKTVKGCVSRGFNHATLTTFVWPAEYTVTSHEPF